jgi:octaprenyl-diphosphate synthase
VFDTARAYASMVTELGPALREVEEDIAAHLATGVPLLETINRYVIGSGGKRLRPLLMIVSARLCGYPGDSFPHLGTVIEYLHSATLLHDDVLDEARLRRGNPSANHRWGNTAAILSGDYLYSRAFALLVEHYSTEITLLLCRTAMDLVEGEVLELEWRGKADISREEYRRVIDLKTASLIAASCRAGALLADADARRVEALTGFGRGLGLAFQIIDDVLDYLGEEKKFGKVPGGDLREGTLTLPFILLLERVPAAEAARLRSLVGREDLDGEEVARVAALMREHQAADDAFAEARREVGLARACLGAFEPGTHRRMLEIAADYVLSRQV